MCSDDDVPGDLVAAVIGQGRCDSSAVTTCSTAVGAPATFAACLEIVRPGGSVATSAFTGRPSSCGFRTCGWRGRDVY